VAIRRRQLSARALHLLLAWSAGLPATSEKAMSDDKNNLGAQDRSRININEDYELRYWSEKFGVTPVRIKDAVNAVGPMADKVEQFLKE
jgi:hypothetical protein